MVLFSPVYTAPASGAFFFDRGVSMLNVAASRAKDAFLVFGDMEIFERRGSKPSNVLARHLLESEEMSDVYPQAPSDRFLITDRSKFRRSLRRAIERATRELHIASPWVTTSALLGDGLLEDNLLELFRKRVREEVEVHVYVDGAEYEFASKKKRDDFDRALDMLRGVVHLHICEHLRSGLVVCNSSTYLVSPYSWLGLPHDKAGESQALDMASTIHTQEVFEDVGKRCVRLVEALKTRVVNPSR